MATIDDVLARVRSQLSKPVPWSADDVEAACFASLPSDLKEFWNRVDSVRLFEDVEYGQWGLVLWSAEEVIERSPKIARERSRDYRPGDIFIGEFLGDSDLLLIRGEQFAPDYGQVMIARPIDRRTEWDTVGPSFTDFLDRYVRASDDKVCESGRASQPRVVID